MKIQVRGWNRNHGWREVFSSRLRDATHSVGDSDVPHDGVNIETFDRPYNRPGGGRASIYFRIDLTQPLNGVYMVNILLSRHDILRLLKLTILDATIGQVTRIFASLTGPTAPADDESE